MSDYNGWSNRETWNVSLWLGNDESLYRELARIARRAKDVDDLAKRLETFCDEIWPTGLTPDGDKLSAADWDEIARSEWDDHRDGDNPETGEPLPDGTD